MAAPDAAAPAKPFCKPGAEGSADNRRERRHGSENPHCATAIPFGRYHRHCREYSDEGGPITDQPEGARHQSGYIGGCLGEAEQADGGNGQADQQGAFLADAGSKHACGQTGQQGDDAVHTGEEAHLGIRRAQIRLHRGQ